MENYRKHVKKLADEKSGELVANGGTDHAEVLIENIFSHADSIVRVFSGELNARVYGSSNIVETAKEFLQSGNGRKLEILIQDLDSDGINALNKHELVKMCREFDTCEIRTIDNQDKNIGYHFVVMDETGYRFEPDKKKPTAVGCFHDNENASMLARTFDNMFKRGQAVNATS